MNYGNELYFSYPLLILLKESNETNIKFNYFIVKMLTISVDWSKKRGKIGRITASGRARQRKCKNAAKWEMSWATEQSDGVINGLMKNEMCCWSCHFSISEEQKKRWEWRENGTANQILIPIQIENGHRRRRIPPTKQPRAKRWLLICTKVSFDGKDLKKDEFIDLFAVWWQNERILLIRPNQLSCNNL